MPRKHHFVRDAVDYSFERFVGSDPERRASYEAALVRAELAMLIYEHRAAAGLTQAALARLIGTTASVISRLEDADYQGQSLGMLRRIAEALGKRVEIRLVDDKPQAAQSRRKRRKPAA